MVLPSVMDLPAKVGHSPFHTKGSGYTGAIEAYNRLVPGGAAAVFASLPHPDLRTFFARSFLAASWYDVIPLLYAEATAAELAATPFDTFVATGTRQHAERDLRGIYKVFLKALSPSLTVRGLMRLSQMLLDFGESHVTVDGNNATIVVSGVPALLAPWQQVVSVSYLEVALKRAGVTEVRTQTRTSTSGARMAGFELVDGIVDVSWRPR